MFYQILSILCQSFSKGSPLKTRLSKPGIKTPYAEQIEAMKSGQYVMYIYGMVPYEDVFGQIRWTQFCNYMTPGFNSLAVYSFYNETDKTRKHQ